MKRKPTPNPNQLNLLDYQAKVNQLIAETDQDPDYKRLASIWKELSKQYELPSTTRP